MLLTILLSTTETSQYFTVRSRDMLKMIAAALFRVAISSVDTCHLYRGAIHGKNLGPPVSANTIEECETACASRPDCYAFTFNPGSPTNLVDAYKCEVHNKSNIGGGINLPGSPIQQNSAAACCDLCSTTPACASWTWACNSPTDKHAPCWLHPTSTKLESHPTWISGSQHTHPVVRQGTCQLKAAPDPGQAGVDSGGCPGPSAACMKFGAVTSGLCGVDDTHFDNPLHLVNSSGDYSGVPLGGIGVGFFDLAPDGEIKRVAINNAHQDGVLTDTMNGTFLAMWTEDARGGPNALVLHRTAAGGPAGAAGLGCLANYRTDFQGLFPTATLDVDAPSPTRVRAWSALKPHDIENSSLPLVHLEVTISNTADTVQSMAVAFSWQDVISRNIFDASDAQLDKFYPKDRGQQTCALDVNDLMRDMWDGGSNCDLNGKTRCRDMDRVPTRVSNLTVGPLSGLEQHTVDKKLVPNKLTMQQYNSRVAILAQREHGDDEVTLLQSYGVKESSTGVAGWQSFAKTGRFPKSELTTQTQPLYTPLADGGSPAQEMASAVALRATVPAKGNRTFRFVVAWHARELLREDRTDNLTYCGTTDVNRMYHNRFDGVEGLEAMLAFATTPAVRAELEADTTAWHMPILASTMPTFLQFKLINSAYTMYTNSLLNQAGHFSAMEGGMGGLAGTQDQRIAAHSFYFKFFTATDTLELAQFGAAQVTTCQDIQHFRPHAQNTTEACSQYNAQHGAIPHFDANIYAAICGLTPASVTTANGEYEDNTYGWLYQLAKAYKITGNDTSVLAQRTTIPRAIAHAVSLITSEKYNIPGPASNTYDDFWELPLDVYVASMYPMVMRASAILARVLGNHSLAASCDRHAERAGRDFMSALWNGRFFSYGAQLDGSGRTDDIMFSGMLAGQMV